MRPSLHDLRTRSPRCPRRRQARRPPPAVRASHKRDVDPRKLEAITERIEHQVRDSGGELSAARVGELCLEGLEKIDRGAYLQFAGTLRVAPPELS